MPAKQRGRKQKASESPKRAASRSRSTTKKAAKGDSARKRSTSSKRSTSRPRSVSPSPARSPKAKPASRGRTPTRKAEPKVAKVSRSRSASRSRRVNAETPRAATTRETAVNAIATGARNRTTEVRTYRNETAAASSSKGRSTRKWSASLMATFNLDFFGPVGTILMMLGLPPFVLAFSAVCSFTDPANKSQGSCSLNELCTSNAKLIDTLKAAAYDCDALLFLLGWLALQATFYLLPVGRIVDGYDSRERLRYRVNLVYALVLTVLVVGFVVGFLHIDVFAFVRGHFYGLAVWSTVISFVGALALYVCGKKDRTNSLGNSGWAAFDYFMGRTRNPRIRKWKWLALFDFKMFFELRPGLLLWALIDVSYLAVHFKEVRALDKVTAWYGIPTDFSWNLALLVLFHVWYVVDAAFCEEKILSTFDIVTEGFGWMLLFGDLAFAPFVYSGSTRYLLTAQSSLSSTVKSPIYLFAVTLMHILGYVVFRASNNVKHQFRTTPNAASLAHLSTLTVAGGRKILISGWWGLSRHPNYIGDILMSLSWSLLSGCPSNLGGFAIAYFYPIFIAILLISRAVRDDIVRRERYGEAAWKRYCDAVKWRVIPYIF